MEEKISQSGSQLILKKNLPTFNRPSTASNRSTKNQEGKKLIPGFSFAGKQIFSAPQLPKFTIH